MEVLMDYKNSELNYNKKDSIESKLFDKRIWRVNDVAKFLNCSVGHIYNLTSDEKIPRRKQGKFLYFIPEEIVQWILQ